MADKLLIVDDSISSNIFIENFNKNYYKGWDIYFKSSKKKPLEEIKFSGNENIEDILNSYKSKYKQFLIIKSSDYFIRNYELDLALEIVETPTINQENCISYPSNTCKDLFNIKNIQSLYYKYVKFSILEKENWILKKYTYQYVDYLFINKNFKDYKIDYVFPYVNSKDEIWYKNYIKYKNIEANTVENIISKDSRFEKNYSTGMQRFRDNNLLKYTFRSIEKNLPWINKVHIIVSSKSQIPNWLNQDAVDIITHEEFIPKNLLPVFSSPEIEMFLPFLPRVSEYFIYGNDDEFITRPQKQINWFFNEKPVTYVGVRGTVSTFEGDVIRYNDLQIFSNNNLVKNICLDQQHCPQPYILSKMKECYQKYEKQILASCTRFRVDFKNFNQWLYLGYNYFTNNIYQKRRKCLTTNINDFNPDLKLKDFACTCINDTGENLNEKNLSFIKSQLDQLFNSKSLYEI